MNNDKIIPIQKQNNNCECSIVKIRKVVDPEMPSGVGDRTL